VLFAVILYRLPRQVVHISSISASMSPEPCKLRYIITCHLAEACTYRQLLRQSRTASSYPLFPILVACIFLKEILLLVRVNLPQLALFGWGGTSEPLAASGGLQRPLAPSGALRRPPAPSGALRWPPVASGLWKESCNGKACTMRRDLREGGVNAQLVLHVYKILDLILNEPLIPKPQTLNP